MKRGRTCAPVSPAPSLAPPPPLSLLPPSAPQPSLAPPPLLSLLPLPLPLLLLLLLSLGCRRGCWPAGGSPRAPRRSLVVKAIRYTVNRLKISKSHRKKEKAMKRGRTARLVCVVIAGAHLAFLRCRRRSRSPSCWACWGLVFTRSLRRGRGGRLEERGES
jgi:hypothetical protein